MRDKRPVDELSIEELEQVLAIRKREARQSQLKRMKREGRVVVTTSPEVQASARPDQPLARPNANNGDNSGPAHATSNGSTAHIAPISATTHDADNASAQVPAVGREAAPRPQKRKKMPPSINRTAAPRFEEDLDDYVEVEGIAPQAKHGDDRAWRRFVNVSLVLVEVAAVFGLLFLGYQLLMARGELQNETRAAQRVSEATNVASVPTLAPTPTLRLDQVVLPGGHVIENGVAQPNYAEVPVRFQAQLRYEYSQPVLERPEVTDQTPLQVSIPAIGIEGTVIQGSDWEALKQGIGQVLNGYNPNDPDGNVTLAAHNDIYGELFRNLDQLEPGDRFFIRTRTEVYTYEVTHQDIVAPDDVWVLESQGRATATLISCYPHGVNDKRIIIFANRVDI